MSSSSLYVIDRNYYGKVREKYPNSWWFAPIVWDVLFDKYMRAEIETPFGYKKSIVNDGAKLLPRLNALVNQCQSLADRICWELSMQQIFFSKDKDAVANAIKDFIKNNQKVHAASESYLELEHIAERFNRIADDIVGIDEEAYPCFVLKNTSVDDGVKFWFEQYNEETAEYQDKSLKDWDSFIAELVTIEDGAISFVSNTDYF